MKTLLTIILILLLSCEKTDNLTGSWQGYMDFGENIPCSFDLKQDYNKVTGYFCLNDYMNHQDKSVLGYVRSNEVYFIADYDILKGDVLDVGRKI